MVIEHLLTYGLDRAGYLDKIEQSLVTTSKEQHGGLSSEKKRAQEQLNSIEAKIARVWQIQMQGDLNSEALKMISEDLNRLAQEKKSLASYLEAVEEKTAGIENLKGQVEFISDRMDEFVRGWKKASPTKKKLLLRRVINMVVVSPDKVEVAYFTNGLSEYGRNMGLEIKKSKDDSKESGKAAQESGILINLNQKNEKVFSSFRVKNGRGDRIRTYDPLVPNQMRYQTALLPDREWKLHNGGASCQTTRF